MMKLRRILIGAVLAAVASGVASADVIISYTVTLPTTPTDLTNTLEQLTAWNPGGTNSFDQIGSDSTTPSGLGFTDNAFGVTMASLDAANTTYTLQSYDIIVKSTLSGTYSGTATTNGTNVNVHYDTLTAVSIGGSMTALTNSSDPSNDIFNDNDANGTPVSAGPDVKSGTSNYMLNNGQSTGVQSISGTKVASYGSYLHGNDPAGNQYNPVSPSAGVGVVGPGPLNVYLSTLTNTDLSYTSGNINTSQVTNVGEQVTVVYDYTSVVGSTPEPSTMALMGGALLGIGLIGKRKKTNQRG